MGILTSTVAHNFFHSDIHILNCELSVEKNAPLALAIFV